MRSSGDASADDMGAGSAHPTADEIAEAMVRAQTREKEAEAKKEGRETAVGCGFFFLIAVGLGFWFASTLEPTPFTPHFRGDPGEEHLCVWPSIEVVGAAMLSEGLSPRGYSRQLKEAGVVWHTPRRRLHLTGRLHDEWEMVEVELEGILGEQGKTGWIALSDLVFLAEEDGPIFDWTSIEALRRDTADGRSAAAALAALLHRGRPPERR